jgi:hypothetical protein
MDAMDFAKLTRQGLVQHLDFAQRRVDLLALLDRISVALRQEFMIPDLELRFRCEGGSGNSHNEGTLRFFCQKTTKDRKQLSVRVADLTLPSDQGERGRLDTEYFNTVMEFEQLLAAELATPRVGVLIKQILDGCRFDPPKSPAVSDSVNERSDRSFLPPTTEDPDDHS